MKAQPTISPKAAEVLRAPSCLSAFQRTHSLELMHSIISYCADRPDRLPEES